MIGGAGLDADQALLLKACALEFFFLFVEPLQLVLALAHLVFELLDLLFQVAHLGLGAAQLLLHAALLLLHFLQQLFQLGDILARRFQLLLGFGALIGEGRAQRQGE